MIKGPLLAFRLLTFMRYHSVRIIAVAGLSLFSLVSCQRFRTPKRIAVQQVILERQQAGMRDLIATMRDSSLIPADQALVIIDQSLVRDLLTAAIPFEREIGNGMRIQVTSATVLFEDGLALVQLDGRAGLGTGEDVYADVSVFGHLHKVELAPEEGLLRASIEVIAYDEKKVNVMGMQPSVKQLLQDLEELGIAAFENLDYTIDIPVRLASVVRLPAIGGPGEDVHIPAASVPLNVSVANVKSFRGKLWITINLTVPGAERRGEADPREGEQPQAPEPARSGSTR
jgi:hypothetical protein